MAAWLAIVKVRVRYIEGLDMITLIITYTIAIEIVVGVTGYVRGYV